MALSGLALGFTMGIIQLLVLPRLSWKAWLWPIASGLALCIAGFVGYFAIVPVILAVFGAAVAVDGASLILRHGSTLFYIALILAIGFKSIFAGTCLGVSQAFLICRGGDAVQSWAARTALSWSLLAFASSTTGIIFVVNDLHVILLGVMGGLVFPVVFGTVLGLATSGELVKDAGSLPG
jgi:hypothetical protein